MNKLPPLATNNSELHLLIPHSPAQSFVREIVSRHAVAATLPDSTRVTRHPTLIADLKQLVIISSRINK